eukprot:jgi/Galph1/1855/GphlegSOOS_G521.1
MLIKKVASLFTGTAEPVWFVAWSFSSPLLASAGSDCTVKLWVPQTLFCSRASEEHQEETQAWICVAKAGGEMFPRTLRCVAFNPSLPVLACGSFDSFVYSIKLPKELVENTANKFEVGKHSPLNLEIAATLEGHESEVKCVSFSSSGAILASCSRDRTIWLWEMGLDNDDFECLSVLEGHAQDVKYVVWHPNKELLCSCSYDNTVRLWVEDECDWYCCTVLSGHSSTVWCASFDSKGERLVTVSEDRSVIFWRQVAKQADSIGQDPSWETICVLRDQHERAVYSVDWSHTSNLIVTGGGDDTLQVYQERSVATVSNEDNNENDVGLSAMETEDEGTFSCVGTVLDAHHGDINCVRWNPKNGYLFASCGDDGFINLWQVQVGEES